MLKIILLLAYAGSALADLQMTSLYGGTILKYYNGNHDTVNQPGGTARCAGQGGELVNPKDPNLNNAVKSVSRGEVIWIGGGDFGIEGAYEWSDGSIMQWTNWYPGEPNNYKGEEDCIIQNHGDQIDGTWNDESCCHHFGYVCQISNTKDTNEDNVFTIHGHDEALTYSEANNFCLQRKSRLAKIQTQDQMRNLLEKLSDSHNKNIWRNVDEDINNTVCNVTGKRNVATSDCSENPSIVREQANKRVAKEERAFHTCNNVNAVSSSSEEIQALTMDKFESENLEKKLRDTIKGDLEFWVNGDEDNNLCKKFNMKDLETDDCCVKRLFICEQASPNGLVVSNEFPVVTESASLRVICSSSGVPLPSVSWYKDNELFDNQTLHGANSTLFINKVTLDDAGMYVCRAKNEIGGKIKMMEGYSFVKVLSLH